jgi:hypothetical protein
MQISGQKHELRGSGVSLKQVALALVATFVVALSIMVGKRMSAEALAVIVGVVCGVAASIPTSVLLLVVLNRRGRESDRDPGRNLRQGSQPPVVVIQGGAPQGLPQGHQAGYWPAPAHGPTVSRQFHVVGGDDLVLDDLAAFEG